MYKDIELGNRQFKKEDKERVEQIKQLIDDNAILICQLQKKIKEAYEVLNELEVE